MSGYALASVSIGKAEIVLESGSTLDYNLRELRVHSLEMLNFQRDREYPVRVSTVGGNVYQGVMKAGLETMVARGSQDTLYTREFISCTELE